ncbi:L-ribulose-5-phosphate 3-epimerase [Lacrimispora xylanolytica]|uniref:L-ribulose-5-phosphate 3-epimerase n=1 Tax=Lacrimispora xylanolytica TaxID=29375 RepID=A0ABY7ABH5_9FIRM|nr:L-ribulose-5-phosphate 3-epimerase [Lacrimispora xylanolytica]WAJ22872.1 L-ribulose-5-phosphate 3-epimerase [Lacrimispora xylanolytica]
MEKAYTLGLYEKSMPSWLGWKEKLEAAKAAGYDFVEISIDETEEKLSRLSMSQAERLELISMMKIVGLPIRTMCLSGHRKYPLGSHDPEIREKGMDIMNKAIQLSDDLGVRIIQLAGYDVYYEDSSEDTREYFLDNLKKATEIAAKAGVLLGFETMETEFMNTVEKSMEYVKLVSSMYLNVYPDIGNITNAAKTYGIDALDDLKAGKGHLVAMHLKETVPGKFREIPFGMGHVDFERAIETAWELGIRKFVTEFWFTGNEEWMKDLYDANRRMTEILNKQC